MAEEKKKKKKGKTGLIIILVIIVLAAIAAFVAFGIFKIGYRYIKVDKYDGDVVFRRDGKTTDVVNGMRLFDGDNVTVKEDAQLSLLIDDDKHLLAEENTKFKIKATGSKNSGKVNIVLEEGNTLIEIDNKLGDKSKFEVTTPNASLSVRGTTFNVAYSEDSEETSVYVEKGAVLVEADGDELLVEAGEGAIVNASGIREMGSINVGDMVSLGSYEQDGKEKNGAEQIEWRVIDVKDGKALLLADKILESKTYDITGTFSGKHWADSEIREWLNGEFYDEAFDDDEKDVILLSDIENGYTVWDDDKKAVKMIEEDNTEDYVFLLSKEEFEKCFPLEYVTAYEYDANYQGFTMDSMCEPTEYVISKVYESDLVKIYSDYEYTVEDKGGYITVEYPEEVFDKVYFDWFLRTTHDGLGLGDICEWGVEGEGKLVTNQMKYWESGIRPAIWIDIDDFKDMNE